MNTFEKFLAVIAVGKAIDKLREIKRISQTQAEITRAGIKLAVDYQNVVDSTIADYSNVLTALSLNEKSFFSRYSLLGYMQSSSKKPRGYAPRAVPLSQIPQAKAESRKKCAYSCE